jgi:hypothetical protein
VSPPRQQVLSMPMGAQHDGHHPHRPQTTPTTSVWKERKNTRGGLGDLEFFFSFMFRWHE